MIQSIATFIISIIIISTLIELLRTFVSSLFKSPNKTKDVNIEEHNVKKKSFGYYVDPIWFESTQIITTHILFRRNYYFEKLNTLRRYKYKHKYNKI